MTGQSFSGAFSVPCYSRALEVGESKGHLPCSRVPAIKGNVAGHSTGHQDNVGTPHSMTRETNRTKGTVSSSCALTNPTSWHPKSQCLLVTPVLSKAHSALPATILRRKHPPLSKITLKPLDTEAGSSRAVVVQAFNPSAWKAKASRSLGVRSQPDLQS